MDIRGFVAQRSDQGKTGEIAHLSGGDEAVAVLVENLEGLLELLLRVGILFSTTAAKSQSEQTSKRD